ncbi:MAG: hypothetical protein P8Y01_05500 [Woeseiaceae bacterium]
MNRFVALRGVFGIHLAARFDGNHRYGSRYRFAFTIYAADSCIEDFSTVCVRTERFMLYPRGTAPQHDIRQALARADPGGVITDRAGCGSGYALQIRLAALGARIGLARYYSNRQCQQ